MKTTRANRTFSYPATVPRDFDLRSIDITNRQTQRKGTRVGADLIITALATKSYERDLQWTHGEDAIRKLAIDDNVRTEVEEWVPDRYELTDEEVREELQLRLNELRESITVGDRSIAHIFFGDWKTYIIGGTSWGDPPSGAFNAACLLDAAAPSVLEAVGFAWPEGGDHWLHEWINAHAPVDSTPPQVTDPIMLHDHLVYRHGLVAGNESDHNAIHEQHQEALDWHNVEHEDDPGHTHQGR